MLSSDGQTLLFSDDAPAGGINYALCPRKPIESPVVRLGDGNAQGISPDGKWALSIVPPSPMRLMLYPTGAGEPRPEQPTFFRRIGKALAWHYPLPPAPFFGTHPLEPVLG